MLWLATSGIAAALLLGGMSRRRTRLTDALREFVSRGSNGSDPGDTEAGDEGPA